MGRGHMALVAAFTMCAGVNTDEVGPWNWAEISRVPETSPTELFSVDDVRSLFYEGLEYKGKPTRVYAYYKAPEGAPPPGGWPGVVCVHGGGGGTAFYEWVELWADHGYAAIAMDLQGRLPEPGKRWIDRSRFEGAGPSKQGIFDDIELPIEEQWFYHAVAQVVRAHSLLRSFPEVNPEKTGITGISWGGILTSVVSGVDDRFKFAVPVYGCGYLHESDGVMARAFDIDPELRRRKIELWDPFSYLPNNRIPTFWINGTNDKHFPLDVWFRSAMSTNGPCLFRAEIRMSHGHKPGWEPGEIYVFADSIVNDGEPLTAIGEVRRKGRNVTVSFVSAAVVVKSELCYTKDSGPHPERLWESVGATVADGAATAEFPDGATAYFFNLTDERGLMVSSSYCEAPKEKRK